MNQIQYQLQKMFKNMDPKIVYVAGAVLLAAMIWASPILFLRDSILGKVAMVASIIALTLYHRVAGIIALIVIIAIMQNMQVMEGFELPISTPVSSTSLPSSSSSSSSGTWNTPDEFKQKFCIKAYVTGPDGAKEGFVPMLRPHMRNVEKFVTDKVDTLKESVNTLQRKIL